jgi:D-3-phosphoglycerate dehydrogenase
LDKILVAEPLADEGLQLLRAQAEVDTWDARGSGALAEVIGPYQALLVRSRTIVSEQVMSAASQLRVIGRVGTGVDNIDLDAATRRGIVVVNAPYGNTVAVADITNTMVSLGEG